MPYGGLLLRAYVLGLPPPTCGAALYGRSGRRADGGLVVEAGGRVRGEIVFAMYESVRRPEGSPAGPCSRWLFFFLLPFFLGDGLWSCSKEQSIRHDNEKPPPAEMPGHTLHHPAPPHKEEKLTSWDRSRAPLDISRQLAAKATRLLRVCSGVLSTSLRELDLCC